MSRLEELRLAAGAATPGPWEPYFNMHGDPFVVPSTMPYLTSRLCDVSIAPSDYGRDNAIFIAQANPETVLALIALVKELSAALDRNQHAFESYANMRPVRDLDETFVEARAALASATWMEE